MREMITKVYKLDELSEKAKERAVIKYREDEEYSWHSENTEVLKEFQRIFPIKVANWSYGGSGSGTTAYFTREDELAEIKGVRLYKHLTFNYFDILFPKKYIGHKLRKYHLYEREEACLTGYCVGRDILEPIYQFLKAPNERITFEDLLKDCLSVWVSACDTDVEYYFSDENMIEIIKLNEYEFTEQGVMI